MGRQLQESRVGCDEAKCVSKGRAYLYDDSNTCYGDDGTFFPMMCADGFLPVVVEDEPPSVHTNLYGDVPVSYFTCCPPYDHDTTSNAINTATRQCSDPITGILDMEENGDDKNFTTVCDDVDRKYPRQMKTSWGVWGIKTFGIIPSKTDSFLCCDSDDDDGDIAENNNFLDDLECVPYRNEIHEFKKAENLVGLLRVISCDFPEGDFVVPRPVGNDTYHDVVSTGRYQCCRTGPALPPFINDFAFKITVYLPLSLWCATAVISAIVVTALCIPLFKQLRTGNTKQSLGSVNLRRNRGLGYSTYNLYLVYLFFFDLVYALFEIGWYGSILNQKFNPSFYSVVVSPTNFVYTVTMIRAPDGPIAYAYVFINMWINVIISWQLFVLLRKSQLAQRISQPSITRVNVQVGAVFFSSVLYGYTLRILSTESSNAGKDGDFEKVERLSTTVQVLWTFMMIFPIACIGFVCVLIWWRNYIPSLDAESTKDRAMRQLFFFFLRIVAIFYGIWFPVIVLIIAGIIHFTAWFYLLARCLTAIQPVLSACMILTKFDVKKYILDLVTLSYLFDNESEFASTFVGISGVLESTKTSRVSISGSRANGIAGTAGDDGNDDDDDDDSHDSNSDLYYSVLGFRASNDDGEPEIG